jgi:hypothetical protein
MLPLPIGDEQTRGPNALGSHHHMVDTRGREEQQSVNFDTVSWSAVGFPSIETIIGQRIPESWRPVFPVYDPRIPEICCILINIADDFTFRLLNRPLADMRVERAQKL